jgi:hypothetical protein
MRSKLCGLVNISASVVLAHHSTEDAVMTSEIDCTWSLELLTIFCPTTYKRYLMRLGHCLYNSRSQVSPGTMHTRLSASKSWPVHAEEMKLSSVSFAYQTALTFLDQHINV